LNKAKQVAGPQEPPDIMPDRPLTRKEVEEDFQKQLALLEQQNKERFEKAQKNQSSSSSTQDTDRHT
jgi:hypothetical protein